MPISSHSKAGLKELLEACAKLVIKQRQKEQKTETAVPIMTLQDEDVWQVTMRDNEWVVSGKKIERFAIQTDSSNQFAMERLMSIINKMGIYRELTRRGAKANDIIRIGDFICFLLIQ